MTNPLVSVLFPCYNAEKYVEEALLSLINQTYSNIEIVAVNDCSTDATRDILDKYAAIDDRIKVYNNEENLKLIKTLNKGVGLCNGKYIARMDADDISLPERIEKQVDFLEKNPDYSVVSTMFYAFRSGSDKRSLYRNPSKYEDLQAALLFNSVICHPASMIRKTLFTELNLCFESTYVHVEDYALWSKALYLTKLANLDEALLLYRVHENQISTIYDKVQIENKKEVFKIHCKKLGLPTDEYSMDIYASSAECVPFVSSLEYIADCERFMLSLLEKNKENHFCSGIYLERLLSLHWLRLCANSRIGLKVLKTCFKSPLYIKANYKIQDFIIFYVKCLFKMEYKQSFLYKFIFR